MKQVLLFKNLQSSFEKDLIHQDSFTNFTDGEDTHNSDHAEIRIPLTSSLDSEKDKDEKPIQRTSSLSVLKQDSTMMMFEFFGKNLIVDFSDKAQTEEKLQKWIKKCKITGLKKIQIKMIVFSELSKQNKDFYSSLESLMQPYANAKIKQIQEDQNISQPWYQTHQNLT